MIRTPDPIKRYNSAQYRFLKPVVMNFFAKEFPKLFGPIMREKLADELIALFDALTPRKDRLVPGQILWNALDKKTRGDSPKRKYMPVILSLITPEDVAQLSKGTFMSDIAQNAIARMMHEAYEQGGILSSRDIGLLTLRNPAHVSQLRKKYEQKHQYCPPHTGSLHDMGSCLSHKTLIIRKVVLEKKDPADVSRECKHSQRAVDRYLKDYQRVKTAYSHNQNLNYVHLVTGIAKHVIKEYVEILNYQQH